MLSSSSSLPPSAKPLLPMHERFGLRSIAKFIAVAAIAILAPVATAAAQTKTDILLVLAVDASGSVNQTRFELQRRGYAEAFRHPRVLSAIRGLTTQSIAVTMTQWT